MSSWTSSESRVISGRVEYFCKRSRQLTVQTVKTRKNPGKRFVTCSKCNVYDFLDDDLPSEYYKELLYGMLQKQKQLKKGVNYEQVVNVLAMDKSMLEEELRATESKMKLYLLKCKLQSKCKLQMLVANACFKCLLQMLAAKQRKCNCKCCKCNSLQQSKCLLQMLVASATTNAIACSKANAYCKCLLQMQ
ncbi:hypothetical protein Tco_1378411 [Tanacetum coccineum]